MAEDTANPFLNDNPFADSPGDVPLAAPKPAPSTVSSPAALEFQDFSHSPAYGVSGRLDHGGGGAGGSGAASAAPSAAPNAAAAAAGVGGAPSSGAPTSTAAPAAAQPSYIPFQIGYYRPYFDVDTADVLKRIFYAFAPFRVKFLDSLNGKPELYGPLWIPTTLIFLIAVAGNLASYIQAVKTGTESKWVYDFEQLVFAVSLVYSYAIALPLIIGMTIQWFDVQIPVLSVVCVYGYSISAFLPAALLCIYPSELVRWLVIVACFAVSAAFLLVNLWGPVHRAPVRGTLLLLSLVVLLAVFTLIMKLYFFHYRDIDARPAAPSPSPAPPHPPPPALSPPPAQS